MTFKEILIYALSFRTCLSPKMSYLDELTFKVNCTFKTDRFSTLSNCAFVLNSASEQIKIINEFL